MRTSSRIAKVVSVFVSVMAIVLLVGFSESLGLSRTSASEDEKKAVTPAEKDTGSGDKKDDPAGSLHRFMRQKMQASNLILEGLCMDDMKTVSLATQTHGRILKLSGKVIGRELV